MLKRLIVEAWNLFDRPPSTLFLDAVKSGLYYLPPKCQV